MCIFDADKNFASAGSAKLRDKVSYIYELELDDEAKTKLLMVC